LLDAGARVAVGDLNEETAARAFAGIGEERLRFVKTDVAVEADVERLLGAAAEGFGRLDIVFNNAGLGGAIGPITEIAYEDWRRTFDILVGGVFLGTKHAARHMIRQGGGGAIINTASIAGLGGGAGPQPYSAAKAAVVNFTTVTAVELAPHRIRVNAICPGVIFTPLMHGGDEEDAAAAMRALQPWPGRGEPRHIADLALFLASPASEFITGQAIVADGGLLSAGPRFLEHQKRGRAMSSVAGFTYGTTGLPNAIRRLGEGGTRK
jgi:NAD(P)-dependent dehydrogenase (short-subunit alcohol dehydrogenase family)